MPFAKHRRSIAIAFEHIGHGHLTLSEKRSSHDCMPYSYPVAIAPCHQSGTGGSAGGTNMEIGQAVALLRQLVYIWSLNPFIAVESKIAIALVICYDKDYIW